MCSLVVENLLIIHKALDSITKTRSKTAVSEEKHMSYAHIVSETKLSTFPRKIITQLRVQMKCKYYK